MTHQTHIFRIKHHLILTEIVECLCEVVKQIPMFFRLQHHVINVGFDISPNLIFQDDVYALLICSSPILLPEGHLGV
jgi:hypothetical protein